MPLGPIFPTGPGKPYIQKVGKNTGSKIMATLSNEKKVFLCLTLLDIPAAQLHILEAVGTGWHLQR